VEKLAELECAIAQGNWDDVYLKEKARIASWLE
jgi:hypothetical protein